MIPLSYGQQRLWLLDRIQESGAAYNTVLTVHLHGPLNTGALKEAVDDLLERHAALRTVFPQVGGTPHQHVVPADEIRGRDVLIRSDVSGSQEERERCGHHSFDLAEELPIHPVLFEVAPHHHVLLLVMHHIAVDGWSLRPLLGDLAAAYGARLLGKAPDWSPLPVQYTDYTLWQRELLGMEQDPDSLRSVQARFWRDELQGLPDAVHLPLDRPRPKTASYRGGAVPLSLSSDVHALLLTLAREERATLFMTLHAGLVALFFRLGAGTDIPLGTPVAGRTDEALDDLVGFFINTLVLRTNVSGDPGFRELLARVRVADLDAFSHQDLPFDQVVETVNPRRSLAHHSLFQTMLVLQNNRPPAPHFPGLETEIDISDLDPAKFDLTFDLWDSYEDDGTPAGVHGTLKYARDLWDAPSAEALGERFVRLLETVARQPETPVSRVDLLSSSERRRLLGHGQGVSERRSSDASLVDLFEQRVDERPHDTPLQDGTGRRFTYAALDAEANRLAHHLLDRGVTRGDAVGVLCRTAPALAIASLAALKAGGAVVPLTSPGHKDTLADIISAARPTVVVSERAAVHLLPDDCPLLLLETQTMQAASTIADRPRVRPSVADVACVRYEVAPDGTPTGVAIRHRGVVDDFLAPLHDGADETPSASHLILDSWSEPALALLSTLIHADTRAVAQGERHGAGLPHGTAANSGTTSLWCSAGTLAAALEEPDGLPRDLRYVFTCGTEPSVALLSRLALRFPAVRCRHWDGTADGTRSLIGVSGAPAPAQYVLDAALRPVPPGVPGELYLAARPVLGYAHRPSLTVERFVADPYGAPGTLMYRTGTAARWRADGTVDRLGPVHPHLETSGLQADTKEIEAILEEHEGVPRAVVRTQHHVAGEQRRVAFFTGSAAPGDVRAHAASRLAEPLVPDLFLLIEAVPLTATGDIDESALPFPPFERVGRGRMPRTLRQEILCGIFVQLLGIESVAPDDDFFALGGTSLLAARLVSRIRSALGRELELSDVFRATTARSLDLRLDGLGRARPAMRPVPRPAELPVSLAQRRLWLFDQIHGPSPAYNVPVALRLRGTLNHGALEAALRDVVVRHEGLRSLFVADEEGEGHQWIVPPAEVRIELPRLPCAPGLLTGLLSEHSRQVFDLAGELPLRAFLFTTASDEHVLLVVLHHIVFDGASLAPLVGDLATAYSARRAGTEPRWTPLPLQYADYALWQYEALGRDVDGNGTVLDGQLAHWRQTLSGLPDEVTLPPDRPRPETPPTDTALTAVRISPALHRSLAQLAMKTGTTLFMVLETGFLALMARLGAGTDLALGTSVADRTDEALDPAVGFFVNTLVLRTDAGGDPTFRQLLGRVRETVLAAYAHKDVPLDRLVQEINPPRARSRNPLFQVSFELEYDVGDLPGLDDLETELLRVTTQAPKVDIDLTLSPRADERGAPAGISGTFEYVTALYESSTMEWAAAGLVQVLEAMAAAPGARIGSVELPAPRPSLASEDQEEYPACPF